MSPKVPVPLRLKSLNISIYDCLNINLGVISLVLTSKLKKCINTLENILHNLHAQSYHKAYTIPYDSVGPENIKESTSEKHVRAMNTPCKTEICRAIPIFLIFASKHRLWVLVRTASANLCFEQK